MINQSLYCFIFQFKFADSVDYLLITLATVACACHGVGLPLNIVFFGSIIDMFIDEGRGHLLLDEITWSSYNITKTEAIESGVYK